MIKRLRNKNKTSKIKKLLDRIEALEKRVTKLEKKNE